MKKLPKKYIILEIVPTHSNSKCGFIAQIEALKIMDNKIIDRLNIRVSKKLIKNSDLLEMISYDQEQFTYFDKQEDLLNKFIRFIEKNRLLIIDNFYTLDYLKDINNKKESVFRYLNMEYSDDIFNKIMEKYHLEPSNHLVDLLYESLMFEAMDN